MKYKYFFIIVVMVIVVMLGSCAEDQTIAPTSTQAASTAPSESLIVNSGTVTPQGTESVTPTVSSSEATPTPQITSNQGVQPSPTVTTPTVTRAEMKSWFELETYDELNKILNFQIEKKDESSLHAISDKAPEIKFFFYNYQLPPNSKFELAEISAIATIMLPEYVDMKMDQIPIFGYAEDEFEDSAIYLYDEFGDYRVRPVKPGILSANDTVYMEKQ